MFKIELQITKQQVANLLCSGFEGGIDYWAKIAQYKDPLGKVNMNEWDDTPFDGQYYPYIHGPLYGGSVFITDVEGQDKTIYELNEEAIVKGLHVFLNKYGYHAGRWLSQDEDSDTGDIFIQCCLFGEVVYG